jgi:putative spermidine/putrescine transport system permease protein
MLNSLWIKQKAAPYILIAPFLLIMGLMFMGGLVQAVVQSLGYLPAFGMDEISLHAYRRVLTDSRFLGSMRYTFYIAITSSSLSVILGVFVAFIVHKARRGNRLSFALFRVPILIPHIVVIIMVFHIFFQTGIVSRFAYNLGIIDSANDFPLLIFDRGGIGIMLVYLYKQVPFVTLMVFTISRNLDKKYYQIAENLGASPFQIMTRITLPLLAPTILSAFLITFAFGFGAFEVPYLLGSPARITMPILAFIDYRSPVLADRPAAMAVNVIISMMSLFMIGLYMWLLNRFTRRGIINS